MNDAAAACLWNFARGHACVANHSNGAILFRKKLVPPGDNFQLSSRKMTKQIPHNAFVFVGDERTALFFHSVGDERSPNLRTESVFEDDNLLAYPWASKQLEPNKAIDWCQRSGGQPSHL
jgi:hypothetical protein